jgi:Cu/Ag efflux protein CusF
MVWLVHEGHAGAAKASGVVNAVDAAQRKVNVSYASIKQLGWPAMTMDFPVGSDVDLNGITPGTKVNFTLIKGSGGAWTVDTLKPSGK